jgi:AcrR family transcriptional regulator
MRRCECEGDGVARPVLPRGFARERVLEASLALFAEHGVSGTSLQMIADRLGVGKASVYYQFRSKDDIVLTLIAPVFDDIARLVKIVEAVPSAEARRDVAVSGLVEMAVRHRSLTAVFFGDPAVEALMSTHGQFEETIAKFDTLLMGPDPDVDTRVAMTVIATGIYGSVMNPHLIDVSGDELHRTLLATAQSFLRAMPVRVADT